MTRDLLTEPTVLSIEYLTDRNRQTKNCAVIIGMIGFLPLQCTVVSRSIELTAIPGWRRGRQAARMPPVQLAVPSGWVAPQRQPQKISFVPKYPRWKLHACALVIQICVRRRLRQRLYAAIDQGSSKIFVQVMHQKTPQLLKSILDHCLPPIPVRRSTLPQCWRVLQH